MYSDEMFEEDEEIKESDNPLYSSRFSVNYCNILLDPGGGGDSHMERTGMLVGNFEFNP